MLNVSYTFRLMDAEVLATGLKNDSSLQNKINKE